MPISKKDAPDTLPSGAKEIYVPTFNSAYDGTCEEREDRDECAAKIAWSAVKKEYEKDGDTWTKKSLPIKELSLYISKASLNKKTQEMRGLAVASDTEEDFYGDSMSMDLFENFIDRIEKEELAPEKYRSEYWEGGMPYLSIAHYSDQDGEGIPGDIEAIYTDGNRLKQKFTLRDNPIGISIFKAIMDDLYSEEPKFEEPIRISIAFIDRKHKHKNDGYVFERKSLSDVCPECLKGDSGKEYLKGQLVHCAFTRVPANPRTEIEQLEERSMEIETKKDDAASIVGEDVAEELEQREEIIGKSETLVVKSEEEEVEEEDVAEEEKSEVEEETPESEEKSMNGPTSISEMKEQKEAAQELQRMSELWSMFSRVVYNIFRSDEVEDKKSKVENAVNEFKNLLEERSMLIDEEESTTEDARKEKFMLENLPPVLQESIEAFSTAYSELPNDATNDELLKAIQPAFDSLGEDVVRSVSGEEVEEEQEVVDSEGAVSQESLVRAFQEAQKPVLEQLSLISTALSEDQKRNAVPRRRSIAPSLVEQSETPEVERKSKKKLSSISKLVNKSVGLEEDHVRPGASIQEE